MSTPSTPITAPNVSEDQIEAYIRQVAADEAKKLNQPAGAVTPPEPAASPEPLRLNIAGKEYTFKDPQEASAVLTGVYTQQAAPPAPSGRTVTSDNDSPYTWTPQDQKAYVDMLVENPLKAQEYLDRKRFGVENPTEVIRQQMQTIAALTQTHAIDHFVATHKDYHVCPENAQAMEQIMKEYGYGVNQAGLEAAYAIADKRGLFKRPQEAQTPTSTPTYNPYLAPPPVASRTGAAPATPNWENDAHSMSLESIENIFARFTR